MTSDLLQEPASVERQSSLQGTILIVDDEPLNIRLTQKYLADAGCASTVGVADPREVMLRLRDVRPDVVLLDVHMPQMSGLELLARLKAHDDFRTVPVLVLTASTDRDTKRRALMLGATDFICKPLDPDELVARLRNTLAARRYETALRDHAEQLELEVQRRTEDVVRTREEVIHCLARAAEFRDTDTGHHILRVGRYSALIAEQAGCDRHFVRAIELAATLHDVGKIGIPDDILLHPGKLSEQQFGRMQAHTTLGASVFSHLIGAADDDDRLRRHTEIGGKIFGDPHFELLQLAKTIALTHHERWDGSGYPLGLAGEDIPLAGRIVAIADVFDALSSKRPYKPPFSREKCFELLRAERGKHFDPTLLDAFFARSADIVRAQIDLADV